ncbi:hypothetical protein NMY3_01073 [Candidatus Nitrosocosmicus oleophilus]|uniref:Uncharacterized protein n=1 Tax=Candidatus Nitrosocosmicus oleophilus TaxID=1353260 RepID=A0A654LV31_9ARCH|nr:hypothetical protein NMY3_01073 [Candidatus Nitrosocosmicus oleophilus]
MHELQNLIFLFHGNILGGHHPNNANLPDLFLVSLIYFLKYSKSIISKFLHLELDVNDPFKEVKPS